MFLRFVIGSIAVISAVGRHHKCGNGNVFDLSFQFDANTAHWPTSKGFQFTNQVFGNNSQGTWYATNDFCVGEHAGTHLDAPYHFNEHGWTVTDIPLSKLINRGYVLDLEAIGNGPTTVNTTLEPRHIQKFERQHFGSQGRLPVDSILLVRFNWAQYYGTPQYYNSRINADNQTELYFPGLSAEAAQLLVDRRIAGVGLDTPSVDPGTSKTFDTHRILYKANIFALENVNIPSDLSLYNNRLMVYALPMKIAKGTGAPCRVLGMVLKDC